MPYKLNFSDFRKAEVISSLSPWGPMGPSCRPLSRVIGVGDRATASTLQPASNIKPFIKTASSSLDLESP